MAMMMTGRALLVCALCVLWSGLSGIAADDAGSAGEKLLSNWQKLLKSECETDNTSKTDGKLNESAVNCCVHHAMRELCNDVYGKILNETEYSQVGGICKEYAGKPNDADKCPKPQTEPSPGTGATVGVSVPEGLGNEEELRKQSEEAPGAPPEDLDPKPTGLPASPPVEGSPDKAKDVRVPNSEEGSVSMEPTKDSAEGGIVPIADTDHNEASNGQTESTTTTPPDASDNANKKTEKGTGENIPNNTNESDVAGTEGKTDENKDNNPNETALHVAGIKTVTTTPGDSDGSTAVSHTTSPLLLLLLVACAAAASVVAA
ncbi:Mucin-associated surface protein (MASP) subgroup S117 [Trypanosoma cruzi]|uniref:Mucin-associated surface protein (MASP) subgroup S117 n=1 Tax=Trypanosoma cruzi TaxID=5693 RepID=A0A7J6XXX6_TRYCR|nr:Mucin-associated surface protein (MASP) subgroup S117 [Trypanosoma cruzi]